MKKLYIFRGIPGSGKTTEAKKLLNENLGTMIRINMDYLRAMATSYHFTDKNEYFIYSLKENAIKTALEKGFDVISDDTNLKAKTVNELHKIAAYVGDVIVYENYINVEIQTAIDRDSSRLNKDSVGEEVIRKFYTKYINDNFKIREKTYYPKQIDDRYTRLKQDKTLPKAIMCDVDGTLALRTDRGPFDWNKVKGDKVNKAVANVLQTYSSKNYKILILTARDGVAKQDTIDWLNDNEIKFDKLFIKPKNDNRKDTINKLEIFNNDIKNNYYIEFVLDDRDSVVQLWRNLGLDCFQVNWGRF